MMVCGALEEKQHICTSSLLQKYELLYRPPNFEHCFIVLHLVNQSSPRLQLSQKPLNRHLDKGTAESPSRQSPTTAHKQRVVHRRFRQTTLFLSLGKTRR